ncbi:hypothetical protein [Dactylosporangium sp. CA-233914]|uniref:hypothetical protein n=1 Tax=Dactylosporangium sp. CA-233914 TaxID=3239934 RepID=UPI003D905800
MAVSGRLRFPAERTVEARVRGIFVQLGLPALPDLYRRVPAVLTLLRCEALATGRCPPRRRRGHWRRAGPP